MLAFIILIVLTISAFVLTAIGIVFDKDILLDIAMILAVMVLVSIFIAFGIAMIKKV